MIAVAGVTGARPAVLAVPKFSRCDFGCEDLGGAMPPLAEKALTDVVTSQTVIWERYEMDRSVVQDAPPPRQVVRLINPLLKALLRSPLHRLLGKNLMLLTVTGRKTGRAYTMPVGRHESGDGSLVLSAGGNWRYNLRGGADVRVTLDGRERAGHAVLEEDPDRAAQAFKTLLDRAGPRALGVKVNVDRAPTVAEIKPALTDRGVAYLQLKD